LIQSPQSPIHDVELSDRESKIQSTAFVPRMSTITSDPMESSVDQSNGLRIRGSSSWAKANRNELSMVYHVENF